MAKCRTQVHRFFLKPDRPLPFKTGVSLHSHTMHSREGLDRLPTYIAKFPIGHYVVEREIGRLHLYEKRVIDFGKYYWTPPLSPREAYTLECEQIQKYGLTPLVSLTDHDNIEAGLQLRMLAETHDAPVSAEWTVPYATLNLTQAQSFEEFVHEIRSEGRSGIALMPQFFEPLTLRLIENAWHALSDAPGEFGRRHWMTRVFVEENGETIPFSQFDGTRFQRIIERFRWVIGLVANPVVRPTLRLTFLGNEEGGL